MATKVFVLGAGSMGGLLAHELYRAFPEQILPTLLMRNRTRLNHYNEDGAEITVVRDQGGNINSHKLALPAAIKQNIIGDDKEIIENLVVSTKLYQTEAALEPYIPHLSSKSNILLLQNGMGMASHLIDRYWPDFHERPSIFQAISTHGAYKPSPSVIHHVGHGALSISYIPKLVDLPSKKVEIPEFINLILQTESLNASYLEYNQFILIQMEKLVVNSCINPLTAILDCFNGDLLYGAKVIPIMKRIIKEAIDVFFAEYRILAEIPEAKTFLNEERLLQSVLSICKLTAQNSSSMREDVKHLNPTEIDWINGYLVKMGKKHRIATPFNKMMMNMVKNKLSIEKAVDNNSANLIIE